MNVYFTSKEETISYANRYVNVRLSLLKTDERHIRPYSQSSSAVTTRFSLNKAA